MSRVVVATALVTLLIVSVLIGSFAGTTSGAPRASTPQASPFTTAATPDVPALTVTTSNLAGTTTPAFYSGPYYDPGGSPPYFPTPGVNSIQFKVHDTDADATVNLTLNDPNATRDGLSNPVFSASVAIDSITHGSTPAQNGLVYTFPSAIVYGGGWNVTVSAPLGGFAFENLTLYTYGVSDQSNPAQGSAVLPGESVTLNWWVVSAANGGAYNDLTNLTLWGSYYNGTAYHDAFSTALVALPLTAAGSTTFTIPTDAAALTTFYFNLSGVVKVGSTVTANWTYYSALFVGNTWISGGSMSSPCGTVNDGAFFVGCPVQVIGYAGAEAGAQFNPVPGLTVTIAFWNGTTHVTPGGNPPTTLSTAANGEVSFSFTADVPPFTLDTVHPFVNAVNITVNDTKATGVGAWTTWHNGSFRVAPGAATGAVEVALNANEYAPGATVTATWTLSSSNTSVGALDATEWELATENGGLLATGSITSTASTGTFTVPLPADLLGQFYVWVIATNATSSFSGGAYAIVEQPTLAVSGSLYFTPGSQLSWNLVFSPAALAGTTTTYTVIGYWDDQYGDEISNGLVATGTVGSSNVVSYSVPGTGAATYYDLEVSAQTTATGVYATAGTDSELETGYYVEIGVSTASNYADGSYQPGQTIQVSWAVYSYSGLPLPPTYQVYIALGPLAFFFGPNVAVAETLATTATSGTIGLTIPSNTPSGSLGIGGEVYAHGLFSGPGCEEESNFTGYCWAQTAITVNAHPSLLSLELGAGSGFTVGMLILLIVIIAVALVLFLLMRRGRSPKSTPSTYSATEPMSPAAPAPSTAPATEWKETPSTPPTDAPAPDAQPPLPTPPSGAQ
ncbi:MAG: hypothetical protein WB947_06140 [Thermoplasmata archaeon]